MKKRIAKEAFDITLLDIAAKDVERGFRTIEDSRKWVEAMRKRYESGKFDLVVDEGEEWWRKQP